MEEFPRHQFRPQYLFEVKSFHLQPLAAVFHIGLDDKPLIIVPDEIDPNIIEPAFPGGVSRRSNARCGNIVKADTPSLA